MFLRLAQPQILNNGFGCARGGVEGILENGFGLKIEDLVGVREEVYSAFLKLEFWLKLGDFVWESRGLL
jgi:hypothetical protein